MGDIAFLGGAGRAAVCSKGVTAKRRERMTTEQICIMATIIAYLCFVIFTGVMIGRRSKKSAEGFYLGGRGIGPLVTAMSAEASDMSSYLLMGIPGLAYLSGVADAS